MLYIISSAIIFRIFHCLSFIIYSCNQTLLYDADLNVL